MAQARRLAFESGQLRLARFLVLRRRNNRKLSPSSGITEHRCPQCGVLHCEPRRNISRAEIAHEKRQIQKALKAARL